MKKSIKSNKKGISLIVLIVTIAVIIVLAGAVIMTVTDERPIESASEAKNKHNDAVLKENAMTLATQWVLEKRLGNTDKTRKEYVMEGLEKQGFTEEERGRVKVDDNGNVKVKPSNNGGTVEMITFTLKCTNYGSKTEYTVEDGTTWYEFCQQYDWIFCEEENNQVYVRGYNMPVTYKNDEKIVIGEDVIVPGEYYYTNAECVRGNTEILIDKENNTKYAKDIKNGEKIMYFDFEKNRLEEGIVSQVYIHKNAINFVKYTFEDGSYIEATDYHPIYTKEGWKSLTRRSGYEVPKIGDEVKTQTGWKKLIGIEEYKGLEDCYDFEIESNEGKKVNNYFANNSLVQSSIN